MAQYTRRFSAEEALRRLTEDVDSDEEDFEELEVINEYDDVDEEEEDEDEDEGPGPSTTKYASTDGTSWKDSCPRPRVRRRNIVRQRGGSKQFIQARVDSLLDIFFELFGHDSVEIIHGHTLEEARRQGDDSFLLTQDEIRAFLGLWIIRGVSKEEQSHSQVFGIRLMEEQFFTKRCHETNSKVYCATFVSMTRKQEQEDDDKISLLRSEKYERTL